MVVHVETNQPSKHKIIRDGDGDRRYREIRIGKVNKGFAKWGTRTQYLHAVDGRPTSGWVFSTTLDEMTATIDRMIESGEWVATEQGLTSADRAK